MQRSSLAKWALTRRVEAHIVLPGLISLTLIVLAAFAPLPLRTMVAPGTWELPFAAGRTAGLAHAVMLIWLTWITVLGVGILRLSPPGQIRAAVLLIGLATLMLVLMWLDGHTLAGRAADLWLLTGAEPDGVASFLAEQTPLVDLALVGALSLGFFVIVPLLLGHRGDPVIASLVPSRWLITTTLVVAASFWIPFRMQSLGLGHLSEAPGAGSIMLFVMPGFLYLWVLYLARIQFRCWVQREGSGWRRRYLR